MTKEEIVYKIEQIAHNGAFDGINADYVEREAEKLADKIVKLFAIPVVSHQRELLVCKECNGKIDELDSWCKHCGEVIY